MVRTRVFFDIVETYYLNITEEERVCLRDELVAEAEEQFAKDPAGVLRFLVKFVSDRHKDHVQVNCLREALGPVFSREIRMITQAHGQLPLFSGVAEGSFSVAEKEGIKAFFDSPIFRQSVQV